MELSLDRPIAGVLVPVFAIRGEGDQGIGDTESLKEFIDWAAETGFRLVKILPINETGGDHSPYNALSSRALEPTTIRVSPEVLPDLKCEEWQQAIAGVDRASLNGETVKYDVVKPLKRRLLEAAFERFRKNHASSRKTARGTAFTNFLEAESGWLGKYTLFRVLFEQHEGRLWTEWPAEQQTPSGAEAWVHGLPARKAQAMEKQRQFFAYVQWVAFTQWRAVREYAAKRGVSLMGDIPFGVSFQSADVWAEPRYFRTDWCGGTPPDKIFKHDLFVQKWGQNWGIPLYDWDALRKDDFAWWRERVRGVREFFDLFRIDHVLGFYRIYGFPWRPERNEFFLHKSHDEARQHTAGHELPHFQPRADDTPEQKEQNRREGEEYLRVILEEAGEGRVIGEDLGEVPDYVRPNLAALGIAGYKIPQWEKRGDGTLIPGRDYERLSLATYGTHDHDTLKAMWEGLVKASHGPDSGGPKWEMRILAQFAHVDADHPPQSFTPELHEKLLRAVFQSNSWIAVLMITDVFARSERFNLPGVAGDVNWTQRLHAPVSELGQEPMVAKVRELIKETARA